jgi:UTP-glucose-1-phosphate uridylyltransferase
LIFATEVPREEAGSYGILERDESGRVLRIIEKPSPQEIASPCFANAGQYVFAPSMLGHLATYMSSELPAGQDERYLTDLIGMATAAGESTDIWPVKPGTFLDAGTPENWANTVATLAA